MAMIHQAAATAPAPATASCAAVAAAIFAAAIFSGNASRIAAATDAEVRAQSLAASAEQVDIVRAELGAGVLTVGASELAFTRLIADPTAIQH